jgi:hypothetical protein
MVLAAVTSSNNSPNEKSEELKPLVVYDMAAKNRITETCIATKKSVSVIPYDDKDEITTSNSFLAAIRYGKTIRALGFELGMNSLDTLQQ